MNIEVAYYTEIGGRKFNEDAVSVTESDTGMLAIVSDGLGGHGGGQMASKQCVSKVAGELLCMLPNEASLVSAIEKANASILAMQNDEVQMKTTIAVCWINGSKGFLANVGDTRIYLIREQEIIYQSIDHTVAQLAVLGGAITADEIRTNKDRNKLLRALGSSSELKIDTKVLEVKPQDRFLICSDGFWEHIKEQDILKQLREHETASAWMNAMRKQIERTGGDKMDNHSAIALRIQ